MPNGWFVWVPIAAALFGGPVGSIVAIVFGWVIRQEPVQVVPRAGKTLATTGMIAGLAATCVWAGVITQLTMAYEKEARDRVSSKDAEAASAKSNDGVISAERARNVPSLAVVEVVPVATTVHQEGLVIVVDVGTLVPSLVEELSKERAEAALSGEVMIIMTTRRECSSCRYFSDVLRHPLMQTALERARLVRLDVDAFEEDLTALKIPHEKLPGFFLLAPDLRPRDGIDVDEWLVDKVTNVAPILHAFVREKYVDRRRMWVRVKEDHLRL